MEVNDSAIPEWTSNLALDWNLGAWNATWRLRHISALRESCGNAVDFPVCPDPVADRHDLGSVTYSDVQLGYRFEWLKGLQLSGGINNLFDKDPPICLSCSLNGYDASTYDIPGGRYVYVRADLKF